MFVRRIGDEIEMQCENCLVLWRRPASRNGGPTPARCAPCAQAHLRALGQRYETRPEVRERRRKQRATPEYRAAVVEREKTPEFIAQRRARTASPEYRAAKRAYDRSKEARTARRARRMTIEYQEAVREYARRPETLAKVRARRQTKPRQEAEREYRERPHVRERQREAHRRWRQKECAKSYARMAARRRRALIAGSDVRQISQKDRSRLQGQGRCYYCDRFTQSLEADHVIPIIAGGGHRIGNLVPACRTCNTTGGKGRHLLAVARYRRRFQVRWSRFTPPFEIGSRGAPDGHKR